MSQRRELSGAPRGVCVWLTGRGGAGKSTLTRALLPMLEEVGRTVTLLDVVPELRKLPGELTSHGKLLRKAYVAKEVVRHNGIAVCVTISSRRAVRDEVRDLIGHDNFVEVFVDVPPEVSRARKAARPKRPSLLKRLRRLLRRLARRVGLARSSGFDVPEHPDVIVDTVTETPTESARKVFRVLVERGFLEAEATSA